MVQKLIKHDIHITAIIILLLVFKRFKYLFIDNSQMPI